MKQLFLTAVACMAAACGYAQKLAVNTDVAMDLIETPSLGVEMTVGDRSSVGVNVLGNYKPWSMNIKMLGIQPEYRFYFSGRPMHGWFVGAGALGSFFKLVRRGKVYDGINYGAGVTFGYVVKVAHRLNVDFHTGLGAVAFDRKEYHVGDNYDADYIVDGVNRTNSHGYYLMPTRIGVSVCYILK